MLNVSKRRRSLTDHKQTHFSSITLKLQSLWLDSPVLGTYICTLQAHCYLLLFPSTGLQRLRIAVEGLYRKPCGDVHRGRCQSLKDDSLSELVAAISWSSVFLVPPSGTGASGVLSPARRETLLVSFMVYPDLYMIITSKTHSLKQVRIQTLQDHFFSYSHNWNSLWQIKHALRYRTHTLLYFCLYSP